MKGKNSYKEGKRWRKQTIAVLGPGSWELPAGPKRQWDTRFEFGEIFLTKFDEINNQHTNKRYFKDILLDEKSKLHHDFGKKHSRMDAVLFVVPTKSNETGVAQQVSKSAQSRSCHHACLQSWLNQIATNVYQLFLKRKFSWPLRSEVVVVSGPSHAEETIVRDITLITAASKDLWNCLVRPKSL